MAAHALPAVPTAEQLAALSPQPAAPAVTETAIELPYRLTPPPVPGARWVTGRELTYVGRRVELVATAPARPALRRAAVRLERNRRAGPAPPLDGAGLRLYLGDRPWPASGEGELLGAVLWKASRPSCPPPLHVERLVSTWGLASSTRCGRLRYLRRHRRR